MANIRKTNNLPRRIADILNALYWATNKLQKNCSSIGFTEKCKQNGYIPVFAKVKPKLGLPTQKKYKYYLLLL